jgi:hypothetical protein
MEQLKVAGVDYISNRTVQSGVDAVMFDIDDTLIFTDGRPNGPIIDLLYIATLKGYKIVIITARAGIPRVIDFTVDQLKEYNIMYDYIGFTSPETKGIMKEKLPVQLRPLRRRHADRSHRVRALAQHFHLFPQLIQDTYVVMGSSAERVCNW